MMTPTLINPTFTSYAGYANYEFTPFERLTLNAGARLDSFSRFGAELTYRTGVRFTVPRTETILRANFGTGFRAPSLEDMFYPGFSNPNLQPERSLGWDAGFEQPLFDNKLRIGANYFQNEITNLIQYDPATFTINNIREVQTIGVETFAACNPIKDLTLRAAYTWLPTVEDCVLNQRLARRPRHSGDFSAAYRFLNRFTANFRAHLAADHQDIDPVTYATVKGFSYMKLDAGLAYDVCKHFTVFGRIENFTDEHYYEADGYPSLGRAFWAGGTIKF